MCVYNFFMDFRIGATCKKVNSEYYFLSNYIFSRKAFIILIKQVILRVYFSFSVMHHSVHSEMTYVGTLY